MIEPRLWWKKNEIHHGITYCLLIFSVLPPYTYEAQRYKREWDCGRDSDEGKHIWVGGGYKVKNYQADK